MKATLHARIEARHDRGWPPRRCRRHRPLPGESTVRQPSRRGHQTCPAVMVGAMLLPVGRRCSDRVNAVIMQVDLVGVIGCYLLRGVAGQRLNVEITASGIARGRAKALKSRCPAAVSFSTHTPFELASFNISSLYHFLIKSVSDPATRLGTSCQVRSACPVHVTGRAV